MGASRIQAQGGPPYYTDDPGTPGLRLEIRAPFVLLAMAGHDVHHAEGSFAGYAGLQLLLPPKPLTDAVRTTTG